MQRWRASISCGAVLVNACNAARRRVGPSVSRPTMILLSSLIRSRSARSKAGRSGARLEMPDTATSSEASTFRFRCRPIRRENRSNSHFARLWKARLKFVKIKHRFLRNVVLGDGKEGKGKEEYLYSAFLHQGTHKALRHGSHSFTCKQHHACLSFVSVHQMAPPQELTQQTSHCSLLLTYGPPKRMKG